MRLRGAVLAALLMLAAVPAAWAQDYRFSVPKMQVVLTVQPDASILIHYTIDFQNAPGAHPIDIVDVGMPTKDYEVVSAAIDSRPLSEWRPSTEIDVGPEVHLGPMSIPAGGGGTFECTARVRDMVFQDRKNKDMASLEFSPTWFGEKYVIGQTDVRLIVEFPKGVDPRDVVWHEIGPQFTQKGVLDPEGVPFVAWQATYRLTGRKLFGCSFPKGVMTNVVASNWWRDALLRWKRSKRAQTWSGIILLAFFSVGYLCVTRATGFTLLLVCLGILVYAMVTSPLLHLALWPLTLLVVGGGYAFYHIRKVHYMPALASGEGGKICRGLTAVESAVLMERPLDQVLAMIVTDLLNKGAIRATSTEPLMVEPAGQRPQPNVVQAADGTRTTLDPYEVGFLDVLAAPPAEVARKDFSAPLGRLVGLVKCKLAGFDADATRAYYRGVSGRAWQKLSAETDPEKKNAMANQWSGWLAMDDDYDRRMERERASGWTYRPFYLSWWPVQSYRHSWFGDMSRSLSGAADRSAQALGGSRLSLDLSGVDRFTMSTLGDMLDSARSGGCAGGGCACAGCACACACAGGGR